VNKLPFISDPRRLLPAIVIAVSLMLVLLFIAGVLIVVAIDQRVLPPPGFAVRLAGYELVAPCPPNLLCDESTPFYAIWWGQPKPTGGTRYRQLFFAYLKSARHR
jgi:hypothetical protein